MHAKLALRLALTALALGVSSAAHAAAPSFVVRCMRTSGPVEEQKYGTYYFFLRDGFVKGFACNVPGAPCKIVSQNTQTVAFETPGDAPDKLVIDLRTGTIQKTRANGLQWTFSCKQISYQP